MRKHYFVLAVTILLLVFSLKAFTSIKVKSATWDETHYFGIGKHLLTDGSFGVQGAILHPPLMYYWHSLPLLFMDTHDDMKHKIWPDVKKEERHKANLWRGKVLLSSKANKGDFALNASRSMMILVGVFLGIMLALWARYLFGEIIALTVLVLYVFSPNILAHTRLITPDIMLAFSFFASILFCYRYVKFLKARDIVFCAVFTTFTLLSKYSGIVIMPLLGLWFLFSFSENKIKHALLYLGMMVFVFFIFYQGNIFPYIDGFLFQYKKASGGHFAFLMGKYSTRGWWYYYPLAFLFKTPITTLFLLGVGVVTSFTFIYGKVKFTKESIFGKFRIFILSDFAFLFFPLFLFFSLFIVKHNQCIGLRYLLPVYPFIFLLCGYAFLQIFMLKSRELRGALLGVLMGAYVLTSLLVYPDYLAFFNQIGGGSENGYRNLVDSNFDWGQDLKGLANYCKENNITDISLSYFGSDVPLRYGMKYKWLPSMVLDDFEKKGNVNYPPKGLVAISVTNLMGVYFRENDFYRDIRENHKPIAKIGHTIFIYDIK